MSDVAYDPIGHRNAGMDFASRLSQTFYNTRAGAQLSRGDNAGARDTLFRSGNLAGGQAVETRQREAAAAQAQQTLRITRALREAKERGQDPIATLDSFAPQIKAMGVDDAQFSQLRQVLASDPGALDTIERLAGAEADKWNIREVGNDVVAINERTLKPQTIIDNPEMPFIKDGFLFVPPAGGMAAGSPGQPAAMTGPAISNGPLYTPTASPAVAGVNPALWGRQENQESGGNQFRPDGSLLTSPKGAFGVAQLMPETARELAPRLGVTVEQLQQDHELNRRAGQLYMNDQLRKYGGNEALALAAYNAGPGRVDQWIAQIGDPCTGQITTEEFIARIPFPETKAYVGNILSGGGEVAQGDAPQAAGAQQPAGTQQLAGGWTMQPFETPAQAAQRARDAARERREEARFTREQQGSRTLSAAEVERLGLPEGAVVQERPNGDLSVVSRGQSERFTADQRQAANFYYRLENARDTLDNLASRGFERPTPQVLLGDGTLNRNLRNANDRQFVAASKEWLAPILRKDTGAAVTDGELITYMDIYIPSPTDDPATIAQKAAARARAEQGMRGLAGGAYDSLYGGAAREQGGPAPRVRFQPSEGQLAWYRQNGNPEARAAAGTRTNPRFINPQDPGSSYANVPSGQYFVTPDGQLRQKR